MAWKRCFVFAGVLILVASRCIFAIYRFINVFIVMIPNILPLVVEPIAELLK